MPRRKVADAAAAKEPAEALARRPRQYKKGRGWERAARQQRGQVTYRDIPTTLNDALKGIAVYHHLPVGEIARLFLEYGLTSYRAGRLQVPELTTVYGVGTAVRVTIFPDEDESDETNAADDGVAEEL